MDLHPVPWALPPPDPVDAGWARRISQGPRTIQQVLRDASAAMDEQDEAERYARDPVAYVRAERRQRTLWGLLFGRR